MNAVTQSSVFSPQSSAREFDALREYPRGGPRIVSARGIRNRLIAAERGAEFFDGDRANGYGGLRDDGRWQPVAAFMAREYGLATGSRVLHIQCEKGYLLREFEKLGCQAVGYDTSDYAVAACDLRSAHVGSPFDRPHPHQWAGYFDLVLHFGIYADTLGGVVAGLRGIQRLGRQAFVKLAAFDSEDDYRLLRAWSLLGETILTRADWREVMAHAGYTGDYHFVTARTLGLAWS